MVDITWTQVLTAFGAGALFAIGALALAAAHGRVAGFSGIFAGLLFPDPAEPDRRWRLAVVAGMATTGLVAFLLEPSSFGGPIGGRPAWTLPLAGLLVGFGTRLGRGCLSGHGVTGMARFSKRSMLAATTFFVFGAITVAVVGGVR